jgi:hypothetical protein
MNNLNMAGEISSYHLLPKPNLKLQQGYQEQVRQEENGIHLTNYTLEKSS